MPAQHAPLPDGRWHFRHGPMDIVIGAEGESAAVAAAHQSAWRRFAVLLDELVAELPALRQALPQTGAWPAVAERLRGPVAQRMWSACAPYRSGFITPMAAVAGAVAQEIIKHYDRPGITRAWVNNGGDIALHLAPGHSVKVGLFANLAQWRTALNNAEPGTQAIATDAQCDIDWHLPVRGIATSGWQGRSFSLGIADSVTVLAATAAQADAAATVIANAVNVGHAGIERRPACDVKDGSDLGTLPVTVAVPRLPEELVRTALAVGQARARELQGAGLIWSATLTCQGQWATTVPPDSISNSFLSRRRAAGSAPARQGETTTTGMILKSNPQPTGSVFA